ncbi:MAG: hypothetical protein ACI9TV_002360 [Sulfurimonas sp.]|jgi:hypothetical protein|uniref:hypothetical protein n=1 Tax=Sulfurimonas sp. TaxID=2022749 RepID=UPI0039E506CD
MRSIFILTLLSLSLFAEGKSLHLVSAEMINYDYTGSTQGFKDAKVSYTLPGVSYTYMDKNYIALASVKYSQNQNIGYTALGSTTIVLEQKGWKYEVGAGYKFYLGKTFFVGPALLFSDTYTTLDQIIGTRTIRTLKHDTDLRLYGLVGCNITKSTLIFGAIELDNDLLSNNYKKDYSQYNVTGTLYQFLEKDFFLYLKYEQSLRGKNATGTVSGNKNYVGYGFGMGIRI